MGFFKKKILCPIDENTRIWIENSMIWLIHQFEEKTLINVKTLIPTKEIFPVNFDGSEHCALEVLPILCRQMEITIDVVLINFYNDKIIELKNDSGHSLFTEQTIDENYSVGLYFGKSKDGKFEIERTLLNEPDKLIATIAHELAHIKISGENRLEDPDEHLIDLVTVFFGIGIFNANSAANFYKSYDKWGYSKQGYLTQQEWGYSLALYAYIREEKNPGWKNFLTPNVKSDFIKSQQYINATAHKVLV